MAERRLKNLLFLCTGNYYRSRFAEILFNSVAGKMNLAWTATSRGLALERGVHNIGPMAAAAIEALESMGVHAADQFSRMPIQAAALDFAQADKVIALKKEEHLPLLNDRFPDHTAKVEFWNIDDALGVLPLIEDEIMTLVARMFGGGRKPESAVQDARRPVASVQKTITVKVGRETAGRRGKGVTTVFDLPFSESELKDLAARLKQRCGTGGSVKDGRIEIQGDLRERVAVELEKLGFKVKKAGG